MNFFLIKLYMSKGEFWVEGVVFELKEFCLVLFDGVEVEVLLVGLLVVIRNND